MFAVVIKTPAGKWQFGSFGAETLPVLYATKEEADEDRQFLKDVMPEEIVDVVSDATITPDGYVVSPSLGIVWSPAS